MAKLIINPASGAKKEIPVAGRVVSIGRDPSNDLVLSDAMVSRRHAILERRGDQYVLRDNSSSNGTMVNGDRVLTEQLLRDGDLIAIGSARLLFNVEAPGGSPPLPPSPGQLATQPMPIRSIRPPAVSSRPAGISDASGLSCFSCGVEASPFDNFCRQCGEKLPDSSAKQVACKSCSAVVLLPAKFCGNCGKVLLSEAPRRNASSPSQGAPAGESKQERSAEVPLPSPGPTPALPQPLGGRIGSAGVGQWGADGSALSQASGLPAPQAGPQPARSANRRIRPATRLPGRPTTKPLPSMGYPAGFWIRLAAYSIDTVIISLPVLLASGAWAIWLAERGGVMGLQVLSPRVFLLPIAGGVASLLLSIVYPLYFWAVRGATPGKQVLGLRVHGTDGETPIGWRRAMLRVMGYTINSLVLGIGFLLIAISHDKRGLHDRLADTCVVRRP